MLDQMNWRGGERSSSISLFTNSFCFLFLVRPRSLHTLLAKQTLYFGLHVWGANRRLRGSMMAKVHHLSMRSFFSLLSIIVMLLLVVWCIHCQLATTTCLTSYSSHNISYTDLCGVHFLSCRFLLLYVLSSTALWRNRGNWLFLLY